MKKNSIWLCGGGGWRTVSQNTHKPAVLNFTALGNEIFESVSVHILQDDTLNLKEFQISFGKTHLLMMLFRRLA